MPRRTVIPHSGAAPTVTGESLFRTAAKELSARLPRSASRTGVPDAMRAPMPQPVMRPLTEAATKTTNISPSSPKAMIMFDVSAGPDHALRKNGTVAIATSTGKERP